MKNKVVFFSFLIIPIFSTTSHARAFKSSVEYRKPIYSIDYSIVVQASPRQVIQALTDYGNLADRVPSIAKIQVLKQNENFSLVETTLSACVFLYCKKLTHTQKIKVTPFQIEARTLPYFSDFRHGLMRWNISSLDVGTHIQYHAELEPKFWIPPVIGTNVFKEKLRKEAKIATEYLTSIY